MRQRFRMFIAVSLENMRREQNKTDTVSKFLISGMAKSHPANKLQQLKERGFIYTNMQKALQDMCFPHPMEKSKCHKTVLCGMFRNEAQKTPLYLFYRYKYMCKYTETGLERYKAKYYRYL